MFSDDTLYQQRILRIKDGEESLVARIIELAIQYGRYGYRRITAMLRQESLKVPKKQPKRRRLWLNDGSCIRLRPERKGHVYPSAEE